MNLNSEMVKHSGNKELFTAMDMSIMSLLLKQSLNIHAYGLRGTGKTSALRSIKQNLPYIQRIKGCEFNCDPKNPICPKHRNMSAEELSLLETEFITMPLLEISHSAKLGTVVGSIDLKQLTSKKDPSVALLPGTIARANRGIIFIDEINRLADTSPELTDVLLDVMGTKPGTLQIEEEGLPKVVLPITISVWAASNPDEDPGPLKSIRKQLSDRFDLNIHVERPSKIEDLMSIITSSKMKFSTIDREKYVKLLKNSSVIEFDQILLRKMASIFLRYDLESLRSLKSWYMASKMHSLYLNKTRVENKDLIDSFVMCFRHRLDQDLVEKIVFDLQGKASSNQDEATRSHSIATMSNTTKEPEPEIKKNNPEQKGWGSWLSDLFFNGSSSSSSNPNINESEPELSQYEESILNEARELSSLPVGQRIKKTGEGK